MRRSIFPAAVLIAAAIMSIHGPGASASPQRLQMSDIKKIIDAPSLRSYVADGTTQIRYGNKLYSISIRQYARKPDETRIEYRSSPLKDVVVCCDGGMTWRYDPQVGKPVYLESSGCVDAAHKTELLLSNYQVSETGKAVVASRRARIIDIKAKSGAMIKRLWVDSATSVTLRTDDYDSAGKLVSSTRFNSIRYVDKLPDSLFRHTHGQSIADCKSMFTQLKSASDLSARVGFRVLLPRYIPHGYHADGYRLYTCSHQCGHKSAYIRYSNGMSGISIFESASDCDCMAPGGARDGEDGRTAAITINSVHAFVIADLKTDELMKILKSLR